MSDRPLTRRELRERERARGEARQGANGAAVGAIGATAPTAAHAPERPAGDGGHRQASIGPVEWQLSTADMSDVRDALDARVDPGAVETRRSRRSTRAVDGPAPVRHSASGPHPATAPGTATHALPTQTTAPVDAPAPAAAHVDAPAPGPAPAPAGAPAPASARTSGHEPSVAQSQSLGPPYPDTVQFGPADDGPLSGERVRSLPVPPATPSPMHPSTPPAGRAQRDPAHPAPGGVAGFAHPDADVASHDEPAQPPVTPGTGADDYFERLAMASAHDAPTGMIVMPEVLNPDITGALSRSGDIMVTGSMRVSRDLSNLGAYRDGLDQADDESGIVTDAARGDHAPVRARDAIAAHRTTGVRVPSSPERRLGTWIWVVVGAIGVAVVGGSGVLLFGLMNGWF